MKPVDDEILLSGEQFKELFRDKSVERYMSGEKPLVLGNHLIRDNRFIVRIDSGNLREFRRAHPEDPIVDLLTTPYWFRVHVYFDIVTSQEFVVLTYGTPRLYDVPVVRVQSESLFNRFPLRNVDNRDKFKKSVQHIVHYGVGAILYALATGRAPFVEDTPQMTVLAVMSREPERPRVLEPSISETLEVVIQRAMAKESETKRLAQRASGTSHSLALDKYAGVYADSMYGDAKVRAENGRLFMSYGKYFDGELEHWHYDTFRAIWKERMLGKTFVTFALDADGRVKSADVEGMTTFNRRPDAADTVTRVVLAASDAAKLTGAFTSQTPALTVEVSYTDGALRLTVPGQPVYTLLADSPTRFRLTGPPNMPAGFFLEYRMEGGAVKELVLIQPTPRPTLTFSPRK